MTTLEYKYNKLLDEYSKYVLNEGADFSTVVWLNKDLYDLLMTITNSTELKMIRSGMTTASYMLLGLTPGTIIYNGKRYKYTKQNNNMVVEVTENNT